MKHLKQFRREHIFAILLILIVVFFHSVNCFVHIELKKSTAKYRSEYLNSLKFLQKTIMNQLTTSFLEAREMSQYQQVLTQKRLATYYGEVNVGFGRDGDQTKSQTFRMLFDTGSCEFWVPSINCFTNRCLSHNRYTQSSTFKPYPNVKMQIHYLSGRVEGDMAKETINLGGLIVKDQVIGIAKEVEIPLLDEVIWDGILGLAYPNDNLRQKHISPIMDNIINQNLLHDKKEQNQFAFYLGEDRGVITFGGADMQYKKNMKEEFKWAPISEKKYWTITLLDIRKYKSNAKEDDNEMIGNVLCPDGCKSVIDSGTYLIYGPSSQLQSFMRDLKLNKCEDKKHLPSLGFIFKGYTKDGKDEAFELILTPDEYVLEFETNGKIECVVGIGADYEDSGWTLGQVFLKSYYSVFDRESEAIGFAKSNPIPGRISDLTEMEAKIKFNLNSSTTKSVINPNVAQVQMRSPISDFPPQYDYVFPMSSSRVSSKGPLNSRYMSFLKNEGH